jgi:cytochrome c2
MRAVAIIVTSLAIGATVAAGYFEFDHQRVGATEAAVWTGGNPLQGRKKVAEYGCIACHDIPTFRGTTPHVGPPLAGFRNRAYIAGVLENKPEHLIAFVKDARHVLPQGAMPNLGVKDQDAKDIAAFLYTLE